MHLLVYFHLHANPLLDAEPALLAGLLLYVFVFKAPEPATPSRAFDLAGEVRRQMAGLTDKFKDKPAAKPRPSSPVAKPQPPLPVAVSGSGIEAGRTWRYAVAVELPAWRSFARNRLRRQKS